MDITLKTKQKIPLMTRFQVVWQTASQRPVSSSPQTQIELPFTSFTLHIWLTLRIWLCYVFWYSCFTLVLFLCWPCYSCNFIFSLVYSAFLLTSYGFVHLLRRWLSLRIPYFKVLDVAVYVFFKVIFETPTREFFKLRVGLWWCVCLVFFLKSLLTP